MKKGFRSVLTERPVHGLKEYYKKNNRYDGLYREYDPSTGELVYEATYEFGRLNGKARSLVRDNRFDYWETSTYANGRQTGPFESRYVKNDKVRETGNLPQRSPHGTGGNAMTSTGSWKWNGKNRGCGCP